MRMSSSSHSLGGRLLAALLAIALCCSGHRKATRLRWWLAQRNGWRRITISRPTKFVQNGTGTDRLRLRSLAWSSGCALRIQMRCQVGCEHRHSISRAEPTNRRLRFSSYSLF